MLSNWFLRPALHRQLGYISFNYRWKSKQSSKIWLQRQWKDPYVKKAKEDGYRCRSAYKLLEIQEKFKILSPGCQVIDCGAAPGSWTQVAVKLLKTKNEDLRKTGIVVSLDLQELEPISGALTFGKHDFMAESTKKVIRQHLRNGVADVLLSDMAPASTGNHQMNHNQIMDIAFDFFSFAKSVLNQGGTAVCKVWQGYLVTVLLSELKEEFSKAVIFKPKSCRTDSSETYICAIGYKNGTLLDK